MSAIHYLRASGAALALALMLPACAQQGAAMSSQNTMSFHPASIQPETTLSISATTDVKAEPDIAYVTTGVMTEAKTAEAALAENSTRMNALFRVLKTAGIADRDIQTSNFSLSPQYDYPERRAPVLRGFQVANQVTIRVRDLGDVGKILDTVVKEGGNTFGGLSFAVEDDTPVRDEARRKVMKEALARAELYAEAAGYRVSRIVTINESGNWYDAQPKAMAAQMRMSDMESAPSPVAGGEVGYSATVNITFELTRR